MSIDITPQVVDWNKITNKPALAVSSITISTTSPLTGGGDLTANRTLVVGGLASLGTSNYLLGVNSGATAWEYKQLLGTTNEITVSHATNSVTLALDSAVTAEMIKWAIVFGG